MAGIPLYSSNHVAQPAYTNVVGDMNANYAADLSKCDGLIFHQDSVGVVSLLSPALQMTSGDWNVSYQSTLLSPVRRSAWKFCVLSAALASSTPDTVRQTISSRSRGQPELAPFLLG